MLLELVQVALFPACILMVVITISNRYPNRRRQLKKAIQEYEVSVTGPHNQPAM